MADLKVILVSDNHYDLRSIEKVLEDNQDADYYLHCGDSQLNPFEIAPFSSVRGNNDYLDEYPMEKVVTIGKHNVLITHGHKLGCDYTRMGYKANELNCDVVFYGHTHIFDDCEIEGIRFINPGSTYYNRDYSSRCYAKLLFKDDGTIECERIDLDKDEKKKKTKKNYFLF